ncbi:MAG: alpha-L-fucosidase [Croceibacterium sp.]
MTTRRRFLAGAASAAAIPSAASAVQTFAPDWQSLAEGYRTPDWFRDAKFGIWAHWGPQCQPEYGDWYARWMYLQGRPSWMQGESPYENHMRRYGHPSETGFLDIIGQWKADNWDPAYLMRRYAGAGARYFMAMGCHHDNLDLFDSTHHEWNSLRVGPQKDIVGTWEPFAREAGLKFGVSNHSGHAWHWYQPAYGYDAEGPWKGRRYDAYWLRKHHGAGKFWDGLDPQDLYTGPYYVPPDGIESAQALYEWHDKLDGQWLEGTPEGNLRFVEKWLLRQNQMVDRYRPDIVFMDHAQIPFGRYGLEALAHYYRRSVEWHGAPEVVLTSNKLDPFQRRALTWNVERGALDRIEERPWQTCTCLGQWHYSRPLYEGGGYKSAKLVMQMLADVVSKNGSLLLSIPMRGDGTIDDKEEAIIDDIGAWTTRNGEAIYATRPWRKFGEGPTPAPPPEAFGETAMKPYTAEDIRFTGKGDTLYAIFLEWPKSESAIASLGRDALPGAKIERIDLLGGPQLDFRREAGALRLTVPPSRRGDFVPAIRIRGRGLI